MVFQDSNLIDAHCLGCPTGQGYDPIKASRRKGMRLLSSRDILSHNLFRKVMAQQRWSEKLFLKNYFVPIFSCAICALSATKRSLSPRPFFHQPHYPFSEPPCSTQKPLAMDADFANSQQVLCTYLSHNSLANFDHKEV